MKREHTSKNINREHLKDWMVDIIKKIDDWYFILKLNLKKI